MKTDFLASMARGEIAYGLLLRQARTVDIAVAAASCGLTWLFLDLEHNSMDIGTAVQISVTAHALGLAPIVRVPKGEYGLACRILDGGATGIIMPDVRNGKEAADLVQALRYAPKGRRSFAGSSPHTGFKAMATGAAIAEVNKMIALLCMVESRQGAEEIDAIAATDGIDGLFLGLQDLSIDLGLPGETSHPQISEVIKDAIRVCRKYGKFLGIAGITDAAELRSRLDQGINFTIVGNDLNLLKDGIARRLALLR